MQKPREAPKSTVFVQFVYILPHQEAGYHSSMPTLPDLHLYKHFDSFAPNILFFSNHVLLRTRSAPLLHRSPFCSILSINQSCGRPLHRVSLHLFPPGKHLMYVRRSLNTGADLSAHIEQISNAALGFGGNNTFIVKYTYNSSESAAHRSSTTLTRLPQQPSMDTMQS
jgi:hypothetical protein